MAKKARKKASKKASKKTTKKFSAGTLGKFAEWVPINSIKPWKDNPRSNAETVQELADAIEEYGWAGDAITVDQWGTIRAGDSRYKAAKKLGMSKVPVRRLKFRDKQHAEMFALAHNKLGERANWNETKLAEIFKRTKRVLNEDEIERLSSFRPEEIKWGPQLIIGGEEDETKDTQRVHLFVNTSSMMGFNNSVKRLGSVYDLQTTTDIILEAVKREAVRVGPVKKKKSKKKASKKKVSKKKARR